MSLQIGCFLCMFVFTTFVIANNPTPLPIPNNNYYNGFGSRHNIYYQGVNGSYPQYYTFQSVVNPIQLFVNAPADVAICISYQENQYPVSGPNLYATCAQGAYAVSQNQTSLVAASKQTKNPFLHRIVTGEQQEVSAPPTSQSTNQYLNFYVKPSANASVILLLSSPSPQPFYFFLSGVQCNTPYYPVGPNRECILIPVLGSSGSFIVDIPAGNLEYYQFTVPTTANEFTILVESNFNQFDVYLQSGYIPTSQWYLQKAEAILGTANITVISPYCPYSIVNSGDANPNQYFIMISNNSPFDFSVNITLRYSSCPSSTFGPNCAYSTTIKIPNLSLPINYGKTTNEEGYYYYQLLSYANYPTPYFMRVSVASTSYGVSAPPLFARRGSVPSRYANVFAVDTLTAVNQVLIRVSATDVNQPISPTNAWYFAIPAAHSNFEIWTGYNCANNCTQSGTCYCNGNNCYTETNGGRNLAPLYERPYTIIDSGGVCECERGYGFSCSSTPSTITTAFTKLFDYLPFY